MAAKIAAGTDVLNCGSFSRNFTSVENCEYNVKGLVFCRTVLLEIIYRYEYALEDLFTVTAHFPTSRRHQLFVFAMAKIKYVMAGIYRPPRDSPSK
ncbi:hypothetical protein RvY_07363-3 [Ramazzottius varieornatus]|uniref:Uncharacterized protein n=1 Tax=Ramazzottius varieornatus TaxID=947166 RepID=A0A1D1V4G7_RAMVA|nr:hypothetical protein RvY_07363-3 [Ramazzottius varieornatus]